MLTLKKNRQMKEAHFSLIIAHCCHDLKSFSNCISNNSKIRQNYHCASARERAQRGRLAPFALQRPLDARNTERLF